MKKHILSLSFALVAALAPALVSAQSTEVTSDDGGVTVKKICSYVTDDTVKVSFSADVAKGSLNSCEAYFITPVLYTPSGTVSMPSVSVEGYRYRTTNPNDAITFPYDNDGSVIPYNEMVSRPKSSATGIALSIQVEKRSACRSSRNVVVANYNDSIEYAYDPAKGDDDDNLRYGLSRSHFSAAGRANRLKLKNRKDYGEEPRILNAAPDRKCLALDSNTIDFNSKSVFPFSSAQLIDSVVDEQLQYAVDKYNQLAQDADARVIAVEIAVASSPDGSYGYNKQLAERRSKTVLKRLEKLSPEMAAKAHVTAIAENWDELLYLVDNSDLSNKSEIRDIVVNTSDLQQRKSKLSKLNNYRQIYRMMQNTRTCNIDIMYLHDIAK